MGRVEVNVGGRGERGQFEAEGGGSNGATEVRKEGKVAEGLEGGDEIVG